ncbi:MAG TPA: ABC transporter permease [Gemmatimonadales bacterium]
MSPWRQLHQGLRRLLDRAGTDRDIADEMADYLERAAAEHVAAGVPAEEARRAAHLEVGNAGAAIESIREYGWENAVEHAGRDLRVAVRRLRRTPWFSAVVVATLAIVIGANTAIFGLVYSIFLRRLPLPHPSSLVAVRPMHGGPVIVTYPEFVQLRRNPGIPLTAAYGFAGMMIATASGTESLWGDVVTGDYFNLLGVRPLLGRLLTPADEASAAPVVVLSAQLWQRLMGGDSSAVGRALNINGHSFTVVGVMEPSFAGLYFAHRVQVAMPITAAGAAHIYDLANYYLDFIARVPSGANRAHVAQLYQSAFSACCQTTPASIGADAASTEPRISPEDPPYGDTSYGSANPNWHVDLTDASRGLTWSTDFRDEYRQVLIGLLAGVTILTLLACANIATLMLARAAARRREFAVCASLGASRGRLVRQLLAESLVLGIIGSVVGMVVARLATVGLVHNLPAAAATLQEAVTWHGDGAILAFTTLTTLACTMFFGLWPAKRATRVDLLSSLQGHRPGSASRRSWVADNVLVVSQLAFALVLVASAALFVATLRNLAGGLGGYGAPNVLLAQISGDERQGVRPAVGPFAEDIVRTTSAIPGVTSVSIAFSAPAFYNGEWTRQFALPGEVAPQGARWSSRINPVDEQFFNVTHVAVLTGRGFSSADRQGSSPVAVVSQAFVRSYFGGRDPIGRSIVFAGGQGTVTIVGVAADTKYDNLRSAPVPMVYLPFAQFGSGLQLITLIARVNGNPAAYAVAVGKRVMAVASNLTVSKVSSLEGVFASSLSRERLVAIFAALFGLVALVLSAIGLYGLLTYRTARRTAEIGMRMALGASSTDAVWLVLRQTLRLAVCGVAVGTPLALGVARLVRSQLYGVTAADPWVFGGTGAVLVLAAITASMVPAWRAARVDPIIALRAD